MVGGNKFAFETYEDDTRKSIYERLSQKVGKEYIRVLHGGKTLLVKSAADDMPFPFEDAHDGTLHVVSSSPERDLEYGALMKNGSIEIKMKPPSEEEIRRYNYHSAKTRITNRISEIDIEMKRLSDERRNLVRDLEKLEPL